MTIYIFRHGETKETKLNIAYGENVYNSNILEEGKQAIKKIGEYLKNIKTDANYASEFKRVKQTVDIVEKISGKKFAFDKRLNEFLDKSEGETFSNLKDRTQKFLADIGTKDHIAICTHGAVIAAIKNLILGKFDKREQIYDFPRPGILWIIRKNSLKEKDFSQ